MRESFVSTIAIRGQSFKGSFEVALSEEFQDGSILHWIKTKLRSWSARQLLNNLERGTTVFSEDSIGI